MSNSSLKIAILLPFYNEEKNLSNFIETFQKLSSYKEILHFFFIDDGSNDNSSNIIKEISKKNKKINLIKLINNYGKENAITYALQVLDNFDYYITLDSDGQHDIRYINVMIEKLKNYNFDSIFTVREKYDRKKDIKNFLRKIFFFVIKFKLKKINPMVCDYIAFDRKIRDNILSFSSPVFFRFLVQFFSKNPETIHIDINNIEKKSQFGIIRSLKLAFRVIAFYNLVSSRSILYFSIISNFFILLSYIYYSKLFIISLILFLAVITFYIFYIFYISSLGFNNIRNTITSSENIGHFFKNIS